MAQWAEIRHLHLSEGVPKKEIARRFGLDVKTVRRAIEEETRGEERKSPPAGGKWPENQGGTIPRAEDARHI